MTNDLTQTIKDVIAVSNEGMQMGYEAGREQGFREGIKAAADLVERNGDKDLQPLMTLIASEIRGLRP